MKQKKRMKKQLALIVLDGWGYRKEQKNNAVAASCTACFDSLWKAYPHTLLQASEQYVGLPEGQAGGSEIGHTTMGAGTVIDTDLVRIDKEAKKGQFYKNPVFQTIFNYVKKNKSVLHVMGLVSPGGIHSHINHLISFIETAKKAGLKQKQLAVHVFTDGRDTLPKSGAQYIHDLEKNLKRLKCGFIASVSGRFYAMDRDKNWDRISKAEEVIFGNVSGHSGPDSLSGERVKGSVSGHIKKLYKKGQFDEHIVPFSCLKEPCFVKDNDAVFFFNFRADRARQLTERMIQKISGKNILLATMTQYHEQYKVDVAFKPIAIKTTLAEQISLAGLSQAHIAETEKFPHATYFLNGGRQKPHPGEAHICLDSRKDVLTHDLAPKMRAEGIASAAIEHIEKGADFIFINFANPDMVGHTANVPAIIEAIEETDKQLERVIKALQKNKAMVFVTADHGNAELNIDEKTGEKHTAHTTNPVPAIVAKFDASKQNKLRQNKKNSLADVAPTVLELLHIPKPKEMAGSSLIVVE